MIFFYRFLPLILSRRVHLYERFDQDSLRIYHLVMIIYLIHLKIPLFFIVIHLILFHHRVNTSHVLILYFPIFH